MAERLAETVDLAHGRGAGREARDVLRAALGPDGADLPEMALADVLIVAGELVENAVDHGQPSALGTIQIGWLVRRDHVEVTVTDSTSGPAFSHEAPDEFDPGSPRGRGLMMVHAISEKWGVERDSDAGTTKVTARITTR
ncbi:ATP-binding protein [Nocardioides sp. CPCC 205120]|uniref:ATP-binding protein n=1 Tax=Nocardioides sp. CPCC 205120 TaxID=3406462 RepID=UPI003B509028